MDRNKAHDVLHLWHGGKSENCPSCNGTLKSEEEMMEAARKIAEEQYYPQRNPILPMDMYMDDKGKQTLLENGAGTTGANVVVKADEDGGEKKIPDTAKDETKPKKMTETPTGFMTDVLSFSEGDQGLPQRIKIIPTGTFNTQAYGEVKISKADLLEMAKNFNDGVRAGVPIDIDHDQKEAAGWIKQVDVADDGMYAEVEWTKLGEDKLGTKQYRFFSPEFAQSYIDPEHSHELNNVLIAGSLVNRPMFKELPAIAGSEDGIAQNLTKPTAPLMLFISNQSSAELPANNQSGSLLEDTKKEIKPMDLQTILVKEKSARTSDEQTFVAQNLEQLTNDQKIAEGFVTTPTETKPEAPAVAPVVTASEHGTVTASEVETLKARLAAAEEAAQKGTLAFSELQESKKRLQRIEITDKIKAFQFNEKGGKIAPAQVEPIVNLMVTMSEPQRAELTGILESLPDRKVFGEMGSDEDLDKSKAADILQAKAQDLVKGGMKFSEAYRKVVTENPDLYAESLQPASKSDL
jgi:hypothetical protein